MVSAIPGDLCCSFMFESLCFSYCHAILVEGRGKKSEIDNLPVLATCWSGTVVMLFSKVKGPVTHGST